METASRGNVRSAHFLSATAHSWLNPYEQSQLTPLPVAIHIDKANLAEPRQLSFKIEQLVRWVFFPPGNCLEESGVETRTWRCDVFEIAEDTVWSKESKNLLI